MILFSLNGCSHGPALTSGFIRGSGIAFRLDTPKGWVIDDTAHVAGGLPSVLYLKDRTWENSPARMHARTVSTAYSDVWSAIGVDTTEFGKYGTEELPSTCRRLKDLRISNTLSAIVYDYQGSVHGEFRRVAYIQIPNGVCSIAFSAVDKTLFQANVPALDEVVGSFRLHTEHE